MFYFFIGLICGVVLGQEIPTLPKLRPHLENIWTKFQTGGKKSTVPPTTDTDGEGTGNEGNKTD